MTAWVIPSLCCFLLTKFDFNLRVADLGDYNFNCKVDITNVVIGTRYAEDNTVLTDKLAKKTTDYNGDGIVYKADMAAILRKIIKSIG